MKYEFCEQIWKYNDQQERKNRVLMNYENFKMKNLVKMKMAVEFMKVCKITKFYGWF